MLHSRLLLNLVALALSACGADTSSGATTRSAPVSHFAEAEIATNFGGALKPSPYFKRRNLGDGISVEIPNDWYELDRRSVNAITEQGAIIQDVAGISDDTPQTQNLIKANSSEKDPGAILSINIDVPASLAPEDFTGMTNEVLAQSRGELREGFDSIARAGGFSVTEFYGAHLDKFGKHPAVVIEYQRTGILKPGDFIVQINQIAIKGKTVRLTMSYRIADAFIWKARMARIRKSLILREAP